MPACRHASITRCVSRIEERGEEEGRTDRLNVVRVELRPSNEVPVRVRGQALEEARGAHH